MTPDPWIMVLWSSCVLPFIKIVMKVSPFYKFKTSTTKYHILYWRQFYHMWLEIENAVMNFGFHKMQGNSRLAENRSTFQEGLCSLE
jgi:hypothetical protein